MPVTTRTPEDWISFLLTCLDNTPAKPDWGKIAADTGTYKSGKFVRQAYANLRMKYDPLPVIGGADSAPLTPKSGKKRSAAAADLPDDDDNEKEKKPKMTRKPRTPKKEKPKKESDDEKIGLVKEESDDELNGDVTIDNEDDGE